MKCYYKALYTEPGSADLVYARIRQQFPDVEVHISESDYPQKPHFSSTAATDAEFSSDVSFAMLAPLTNNNYSPAEQVTNNNTGLSPSPYGALDFLIDPKEDYPDSMTNAVIYGSCDTHLQPAVTQNLRRYGADVVMVSRNRF